MIFSVDRIKAETIKIVAICESFPEKMEDYFGNSLTSMYVINVLWAFNNAGIKAENIDDLIRQGIYLTVAVKDTKKGLTIPSKIIEKHSLSLEKELSMFPNIRAIILMGDTAIKAINFISKRKNKTKVIPTGSTYKIRNGKYFFDKIRVFPSYLPTGKNFLIEKSKRKMVIEDIKKASSL